MSKENFNGLFNPKNYSENNNSGSVAEYFHDNSFGKIKLDVEGLCESETHAFIKILVSR